MRSIRLLSLLGMSALTLALAPAASAAPFTVNSAGDAGDANTTDGVCLTSGGTCTLRAAIEQANSATSAGLDTVKFSAGVAGSEIALGSPIQNISETLTIDGCSSNTSSTKPCIGLSAPTQPSTNGLNINAADVTVKGIAFHDLNQGIFYGSGSTGLIARNNWFGLKLDGTVDGTGTGITDTGSNARIGGTSPEQRNVFAGNGTGVSIFASASGNVIQGNYFGVLPNGLDPAPNGTNIEAGGNGNLAPQNNTIGGTLSADAVPTPECDGACNVIAGATNQGIELAHNSNPPFAAGATTIRGNYIGLNAAGTGAVGNGHEGIHVGPAQKITIGGTTAADRNVIAGNATGVSGGGSGSLLVRNNYFGLNAIGNVALPNTTVDAAITSANGAVATVQENRFAGNGSHPTNGLTLGGTAGKVIGNIFGVGTGGQLLGFAQSDVVVTGSGHVIGQGGGGNVIARSGGGAAAVLLDGADATLVQANFIGQDASNAILGNNGAGVRLQNDADNNTVGGGSSTQNAISNNNGRPAIVVANSTSTGNLIGRNRGSGNSLFIDLGANGIGNSVTGPNGGAQAPTITTATTTQATGTAPANATVRVFQVGSTLGTISGFAGQTTANGGGNWTLVFGSALSPGTKVSATQTVANNTSELTSPSVTVS